MKAQWKDTVELPHANDDYRCGHCHQHNMPSMVMRGSNTIPMGNLNLRVCFCAACGLPSFFDIGRQQVPGELYGETSSKAPEDIKKLYDEARKSFSLGCYTAVTMVCRKIIMSVAVGRGADQNMNFVKYVDYISSNLLAPAQRAWIDKIRLLGNEAAHKISSTTVEDARTAIDFTGMLLRLSYDYLEHSK